MKVLKEFVCEIKCKVIFRHKTVRKPVGRFYLCVLINTKPVEHVGVVQGDMITPRDSRILGEAFTDL